MHKSTTQSIEQRIADRTTVDPDTGCWNWTGRKTHDGYGRTEHQGATYVHRISYELFVGPIPQGYEVDHLCRNTSCCNPAHLEPVTKAENLARRVRLKTCRREHDETSMYVDIRGRRRCRECRALTRTRTSKAAQPA